MVLLRLRCTSMLHSATKYPVLVVLQNATPTAALVAIPFSASWKWYEDRIIDDRCYETPNLVNRPGGVFQY